MYHKKEDSFVQKGHLPCCGLINESLKLLGVSLVNEKEEEKELVLGESDNDVTDVTYKKMGTDYMCSYTWSDKLVAFNSQNDPVIIFTININEAVELKDEKWFLTDVKKTASDFYDKVYEALGIRHYMNSIKMADMGKKKDPDCDEGGQGGQGGQEPARNEKQPEEGLLKEDSIKGADTAMKGCLGGTFGSTTGVFGAQTGSHNPMKDFEVVSPPDESISSLAFSPASLSQNFLIAGSWDNQIRCWEVQNTGQTIPKAQQTHQGPILDVAWSDDGTKVFSSSYDKTIKMWDLNSNQAIAIAQHDAPVKTVHWIKAPNYSCVMTGSWDKTLKFWDTRTPNPMLTINLPERCYCADVFYPMAVVGTAGRGIIVYQLESQPQEFKKIESPLKYQHRCVSIFLDKKGAPCGFALGSVEGRVAIQYVNPQNPKDNFTFKCHRSNGTTNGYQDIYAVNDISFHPVHGTLATVGSDGRFSFWDKDARTKLKTSEQLELAITRCCFNARGEIFAYSVSYDWSKGHEFYNPQKKNCISLHPCYEELKPRNKK